MPSIGWVPCSWYRPAVTGGFTKLWGTNVPRATIGQLPFFFFDFFLDFFCFLPLGCSGASFTTGPGGCRIGPGWCGLGGVGGTGGLGGVGGVGGVGGLGGVGGVGVGVGTGSPAGTHDTVASPRP